MRGPASASASLVAAAAALLLLVDGCGGAMYKVGDLDAWGIPPASKPDVYSRWAKSIHFALGDSIWFLYPPSQDSVVQVTPRAFAACAASDPVLKLDDGNSVFNLTTPGRVYYISAAPGHCRKGQRLAVDVPMANGTYLPPTDNDLAAFAPMPAAEAPAGFESAALGPAGAHPSSAAFRAAAAGAGSVVLAALSFAVFLQ
ncbi:stellacyanin [Oryza brachyantha]|uniref:stellacyanin n=1 Tax=Oryza brachyantha TaxID=4533 RepID=UPI001ADAD0D0|nr:stellacyanin [Oryza brachyantha]